MREDEFAHLYFFHIHKNTFRNRNNGHNKKPKPRNTDETPRGEKRSIKAIKYIYIIKKNMKCNMKAAFKGRVMEREVGDAGETVGQPP